MIQKFFDGTFSVIFFIKLYCKFIHVILHVVFLQTYYMANIP